MTSKSPSGSEIIDDFLFIYLFLFFKIIFGDGLTVINVRVLSNTIDPNNHKR